MPDEAPVRDQLVVELYVRNLAASRAVYERLGFRVTLDKGNYAELAWGNAWLMLDEDPDVSLPPHPVGNIRVMVPDVDRYWALCRRLGLPVVRPLADRDYGLRDFTVAGPDGLGLRFASRLTM
ncbi:MAG TPA: VOC family protein [Thermomicrobiaceae bacterium]|nr:VOC family protein [Thermomicrobiaceae bacterium]